MSKPTVFFSHSSLDQRPLARLKDLFLSKTGGSIDVFLSSDGQSIPFGRNWVHSVEQALEQAKLMLVFVTPASIRSNWLYFESGYAYSKGLRVVPVGIFGADLAAIPPPLSLLQGFNVASEAGMGNIIAVANEVFGHKHAEHFTIEEYLSVHVGTHAITTGQLGRYSSLIHEVCIEIEKDSLVIPDPIQALEIVADLLQEQGHEHQMSDKRVDVVGVTFYAQIGNGPDCIRIQIDPAVMEIAMGLLHNATPQIRKGGLNGLKVRLDFVGGVKFVRELHKITGRLVGTEVKLAAGTYLRFRTIEFHVGLLMSFTTQQVRLGAAYLYIRATENTLPLDEVRDLLDLLFDREVLYLGEPN
jgi:TIR domain-containing protein